MGKTGTVCINPTGGGRDYSVTIATTLRHLFLFIHINLFIHARRLPETVQTVFQNVEVPNQVHLAFGFGPKVFDLLEIVKAQLTQTATVGVIILITPFTSKPI